jgi:signal transduction histidine kinase
MSALEALASRVSEMFKISCLWECPHPVAAKNNTVATHLFRIAQEAVANSIKHGRATEIKIKLTATSRRIGLAVSDNGVGLKKRAGRRKGLGMQIMKDRAGVMGGVLEVRRNSEGGVDVVCTVEKTDSQRTE